MSSWSVCLCIAYTVYAEQHNVCILLAYTDQGDSMTSMTRHQINRHPVAFVLLAMVFGPYLLAAALLILVVYVVVGLLSLAFAK